MNYKTCLLRLSFLLILLGFSILPASLIHAVSNTYYVDQTAGNDSNDGLTTSTPWKTLAKVSGVALLSGDIVSFKRGERWSEQLTVKSGVTYNAYGTGSDPLILGADPVTGWQVDLTPVAATVVQTFTAIAATFTSTIVATVPAGGVAIGNHLIVSFYYNVASGVPTVSDSRGNTYQLDVISTGNGQTLAMLSSKITVALQSGDTITATGVSGSRRAMAVREVSGLATSAWFDVSASSTPAVATTALVSGTTTATTQTTEFLSAAFAADISGGAANGSPGATWSEDADFETGTAGSQRWLQTEYKSVSSTGTYAASTTLSASKAYNGVIATYKTAGGGGTVPNRFITTGTLAWTPAYVFLEATDIPTRYEKKGGLTSTTAARSWFFDTGTSKLYMVTSGETPGSGNIIYASRRNTSISPQASTNVSNVTLSDLRLRYSNDTVDFYALIHAFSPGFLYNGWTLNNILAEWSGGLGIQISNNTFVGSGGLTLTNVTARNNHGHGAQLSFYTGLVVSNSHFDDNGLMGLGTVVRDSTISDSTFHRNAGASAKFGAQAAAVQGFDDGLYVAGSEASFTTAYNTTVARNYATGNTTAGFATDALSDNNTFINNISTNNLYGLFFEGGTTNGSSGNKAYHNVLANNTNANLFVDNGHGAFDARNNIFYGSGKSINVNYIYNSFVLNSGAVYKHTHARWEPSLARTPAGSILTPGSSASLSAGQWWWDGPGETFYVRLSDDSNPTTGIVVSPRAQSTLDYNLYYLGTSAATWSDASTTSGSTYSTLANLQAGRGVETHGVSGDPQFTNVASQIFTLLSSSPAINAGVAISGINDTYKGTAPDMGYSEYTQTTAPTVSILAPVDTSSIIGSGVPLTASASAAALASLVSVQFQIDGTSVGSAVTTAPYTYLLDTTSLANGVHTIIAVALDNYGNYATSSAVSVTISNTSLSITASASALGGSHRYLPIIPVVAVSTTTPAYLFRTDHRAGETNPEILFLQQYLNTHSFILAPTGPGSPGNETIKFGALTFTALKKFQAANNLPSTGYFGPMTRRVIGGI